MRSSTGPRRVPALLALLVFLLGNNFCLIATPLAGACPGSKSSVSGATRVHVCCAAAAAKKQRADQATREATAPCCVAISATIVPATAVVEASAPVLVAVVPTSFYSAGAVDFARAASVEASLPPPPRSATPAAGRAPPRN